MGGLPFSTPHPHCVHAPQALGSGTLQPPVLGVPSWGALICCQFQSLVSKGQHFLSPESSHTGWERQFVHWVGSGDMELLEAALFALELQRMGIKTERSPMG